MAIQNPQAFSIDELSQDLLEKYNTRGPRYTSYPTAPVWTESFGAENFRQAIVETNAGDNAIQPQLSLYTHIPFCTSRCLYCSCNVVITRQTEQAEKYLDYLFRDIEQTAALINPEREVVQFHWGGGTPTYLTSGQMERLFRFYAQHFRFSPQAEVAIEIDPRVTSFEQLQVLRELGFNRVSLGVQDFEEEVQIAVNRVQPVEMTEAMVVECRRLGYESINFDLIYGLPHQSVETFQHTLEEVIRISPDRIALYNYAHVPWISPHQKMIPEAALPDGPEKFRIFRMAIQRLLEAGYVYIGMDHFAKPQDELNLALSEGRLHRNFMGYTVFKGEGVQADTELYGFGVSAISCLDRYYVQNEKKLSTYYEALDRGHLPVKRGYALSNEDMLRRHVILSILCQGHVDFKAIESRFGIDFRQHFAGALQALEEPTRDGLICWVEDGFVVTPLGRIFNRNIAMGFDAYLQGQVQQGKHQMFSKTL